MAFEDKSSDKLKEPLDLAQKFGIAVAVLFTVVVQFRHHTNIDITFLDSPNIYLEYFDAFLKRSEISNAEVEAIFRVQHFLHLCAKLFASLQHSQIFLYGVAFEGVTAMVKVRV